MTTKTINLAYINSLDESQAIDAFCKCSGSDIWAQAMAADRPFASEDEVKGKAESAWNKLSHDQWLKAFAIHPKIGDKESLRQKFASTTHWASNEQGGVSNASDETIERLASGNSRYEEKFGYIFIVCATGKSATEMLTILEERLTNDTKSEFAIACHEQKKITQLRLEKLEP